MKWIINKVFNKWPWHLLWLTALWVAIFFPCVVKADELGFSQVAPKEDTSIIKCGNGGFKTFNAGLN